MKSKDRKKASQLGMNMSTARNRLLKDVLFTMAVAAGHRCYRCGENLDKETFSIEHKTPWLDSEDPRQVYFDLNNIAFSHHACNSASARSPRKKYFTEEEKRLAKVLGMKRRREKFSEEQRRIIRRDQYLRTGN